MDMHGNGNEYTENDKLTFKFLSKSFKAADL